MGYEQNNGYYQNDGSHDQSWRDQTNVYQTQREQPTPMGRRSPCRKSGWFKGLLAVLLVVAISFGAFYLIRNVGVRLEKTEDGFTLSMTDRTRTPEQTLSAPEDTQQLLPEAAASNSDAPQTGAPASKPESGRVCRLRREAQHRLRSAKLRHDLLRRRGRAVFAGYLQPRH